MAPTRKTKSTLSKLLLLVIFVAIVISVAYAILQSGPWIVPEEAKKVKNPLVPSESALAASRSTYLDKCSECHGDSGRGDGPQAKMYNSKPSDLTDASRLDNQTDGELFYKITHGHRPMPSFRKRLTDEQRWQLVLLIRALSHPASTSVSSVK